MEDTESSGLFNQELEFFHSYLSSKKKEFVFELKTDYILFNGICKRFKNDKSEIAQARLQAIYQQGSLEISDFILNLLSDVVIIGSAIDAIHDLTNSFSIIFCGNLNGHPKLLSEITMPTLIYHTGNSQGISSEFIIATIWMNIQEHPRLSDMLTLPLKLMLGFNEVRENMRTVLEYIETYESPLEKIYKQQKILFQREAALSKQQTEMLIMMSEISHNTCKCLIA